MGRAEEFDMVPSTAPSCARKEGAEYEMYWKSEVVLGVGAAEFRTGLPLEGRRTST